MAIPAPEVGLKRPGSVRSSRRSCNLTSQSQQELCYQTLAVYILFVPGWATSYCEYISGYRYLSGGRWFVRQARMNRINVVENSSCGVNICWWTCVFAFSEAFELDSFGPQPQVPGTWAWTVHQRHGPPVSVPARAASQLEILAI